MQSVNGLNINPLFLSSLRFAASLSHSRVIVIVPLASIYALP